MRSSNIGNNQTMTYPDEVSFCFNPMLVSVRTSGEVTLNISDGTKIYTDYRSSFAGKVEFDIATYVQTLFGVDGKTLVGSKVIRVDVAVVIGLNIYLDSFTTLCIWGAMNIGEVFNTSRKVTWFRKFPFTLSMFVAGGAIIRVRYDGNGYKDKTLPSGLNHLDVTGLFPNAKEFGVIRLDESVAGSTFEYTFDNSFRGVGDGVIINRMIIDDSECGVYLRWIDRHGFYQYWLFKEGDRLDQSGIDGEKLYMDYSDNNYYYNGVARYQGKAMQGHIKACAVLVDQETFKMLISIHSSPLVDLYMNGIWIPVNLANATDTNTGRHLQDFEIEIVLPETISQKL